MTVFDGMGREMCRVRSDLTNTPLQALTLQNDVTFVEAARHLAERMIEQSSLRPDGGLRYAWHAALARPPTHDELNVLRNALERYTVNFEAAPDEALRLLSYGESKRNSGLNPTVHAAYTLVALSILNLDETITKR